jgi:hypothetical protein
VAKEVLSYPGRISGTPTLKIQRQRNNADKTFLLRVYDFDLRVILHIFFMLFHLLLHSSLR